MPSQLQSTTRFNATVGEPNRETSKPTLLVVDDDRGARQSLRVLLKDDYDVVTAEDAHQALSEANARPIDVAILDIIMPEVSGTELLDWLKHIDSKTEVIMLTAYETVDTARQAIRSGACDYLRKPFDLATVKEAVARAYERRQLALAVQGDRERLQELKEEVEQHKLQEEMFRTEGQVYAGIIHDLNNPLTAIAGYIDLVSQQLECLNRLEGEDLERIREKMTRIRKQAGVCTELSRRYVKLSKKGEEGRCSVGLNQVLQDLELLLRQDVATTNRKVHITPLKNDVQVVIDGTELIQILLNLTINAFQASDTAPEAWVLAEVWRGGVDLESLSDTTNERWIVSDGFQQDGPLVSVSVEDSGPGVPLEILDQIFEDYFTTKPTDKGTGLGLSIVKRLVCSANGILGVCSKPGEGARFTIILPARLDR